MYLAFLWVQMCDCTVWITHGDSNCVFCDIIAVHVCLHLFLLCLMWILCNKTCEFSQSFCTVVFCVAQCAVAPSCTWDNGCCRNLGAKTQCLKYNNPRKYRVFVIIILCFIYFAFLQIYFSLYSLILIIVFLVRCQFVANYKKNELIFCYCDMCVCVSLLFFVRPKRNHFRKKQISFIKRLFEKKHKISIQNASTHPNTKYKWYHKYVCCYHWYAKQQSNQQMKMKRIRGISVH